MQDNIKIFISYHKDSKRLESEIMTPIHVGAKKSRLYLDMKRDDEGDNISEKNDRYCELTAQYWAWKNVDADYYGFMHYRRQFVFKDVTYESEGYKLAEYDRIDESYRKEIGLYDEDIRSCLNGYDIILPFPTDVSCRGVVSNEIQYGYLEHQHIENFHIVCQTVIALYPEYEPYVLKFRTGHMAYWYNMFIMKKELFMDYSKWLFSVLESAEKEVDFTGYNEQETRALAFMAERLFTIYVMKLFDDRPELKVKNLKQTIILNTDVGGEQFPVKNKSVEMVEEGRKTVVLLEKAYQELEQIDLPYNVEDVFLVKESRWEKLLQTKEVVFYGGGYMCGVLLGFFEMLGFPAPMEIWDKRAEEIKNIEGIPVLVPTEEVLATRKDACVIVTLEDGNISKGIQEWLQTKGIADVAANRELLQWIAYKIWKARHREDGC